MAAKIQYYRGYELRTVQIPLPDMGPYTRIIHRGETIEIVENVEEARIAIDGWMDAR